MSGIPSLSMAAVRDGVADCVIRYDGTSRALNEFLAWIRARPATTYRTDRVEVLIRAAGPDGTEWTRHATLPELVHEARHTGCEDSDATSPLHLPSIHCTAEE